MIAKKIHHPAKLVTNPNAPPAITNLAALCAAAVFIGFSYAKARFQYAPARHPNAAMRERKMVKKTMLVRRLQTRKMTQTRPMKSRKKAKLALKAGCCWPSGLPGLPIAVAISEGAVT